MVQAFRTMMLLAALILAAGTAQAQQQTAVVEDLSGTVSGIEVFDFLAPGKTVTLPAGARLVLGYMNSCMRETITGPGTVAIGETGSKVTGAKLQTEQLKCASANQLAQGQAGKSAAMVFRGQPGSGRKRADIPQPSAVLMYTSPAFQVTKSGQLTIERLDVAETVQVFQVTGKLFDYSKTGKKLDAGGYYRAELNGKSTIFQISLDAGEGGGPLLLRLVRF